MTHVIAEVRNEGILRHVRLRDHIVRVNIVSKSLASTV